MSTPIARILSALGLVGQARSARSTAPRPETVRLRLDGLGERAVPAVLSPTHVMLNPQPLPPGLPATIGHTDSGMLNPQLLPPKGAGVGYPTDPCVTHIGW